jgi:hypothetical protein
MNKIIMSVLCGCLLFCVSDSLRAQASRSHNLGNIEYTSNEAFTEDDAQYPRIWNVYPDYANSTDDDGLDMLHTHGITIGVNQAWTDETGAARAAPQIAQTMHNKFTDIENVVVAVADAQKRTYRTPWPTKILDGSDRTSILPSGDPVSSATPSDVMIYQHCTTWTGLDIERWSYSFVNTEYQDFIIVEYVFTNTSGGALDDVYIGLTSHTSADAMYGGVMGWGNYYGVDYQHYAAGDMTADSMRTWYSWQGDDATDLSNDTKARPDAQWGHYREPQYFSYSLLHADTSPGDETDNPAFPAKAGWSQRELNPSLSEATHEDIYEFLSGPWDADNATAYSRFVDDTKTTDANGMYRMLIDDFNEESFDSQTEEAKAMLYSCGPYDMAAGEDVRIVMAFAGGSITARQSIDLGAAYATGFTAQEPLKPLPYDIDDLQGNLIVASGNTVTKAQRDQVLELGRDYVFQNAYKALQTWKNGNVRKGMGSFNIPLAPASPSLTGTSQNDQILLEWGQEAANDMDGGPAVSYKIYRDKNRSESLDSPTDDIYEVIATVSAGTYTYLDQTVQRGQDFYYYITAVNAAGIESSIWGNRTGTSSDREDEALAPTRGPSANWQNDPKAGGVVVVPNPFHASASSKYDGNRLNFLNLPAYADIKIYTMTGEHIQTIEHTGGTGDVDWERQDTFSTMEIVSGVYIYVVVENDAAGKPTGEKQIGKFVVIK